MTAIPSVTDHLLLGIENHVRTAALIPTPAHAGDMAVDNIRAGRRDTALRVLGSSLTLTGVLPVTQAADLLAMAHHNLSGLDTWRLRLYGNDTAGGTPVYDSQLQTAVELIPLGQWRAGVDPYGGSLIGDLTPFTLHRFSSTFFRSFRLDLTAGADYVQLGYLFIGAGWQPRFNFRWGQQLLNDDQAEFEYTLGGVLETYSREARRQITLELGRLVDSDRNTLLSKLRQVGSAADIIASLYPSDTDPVRRITHNMVCKIPSTPWAQDYYDRSSTSLTLLEV